MSSAWFSGEIEIDSTNHDVSINGSSSTLSDGSYFVYCPTSSTVSLVDSLIAAWSSTTVTPTISEGKLTLSAASNFSFTISSDIADALGFVGVSKSGASSYTADYYLRYSWYPGSYAYNDESPSSRRSRKEALTATTYTGDEHCRSALLAMRSPHEIEFSHITEARAWNLNADWRSYEEFWDDVLSRGVSFCYLPNIDGSYWHKFKHVLSDDARQNIKREFERYNLWHIKLGLMGVP